MVTSRRGSTARWRAGAFTSVGAIAACAIAVVCSIGATSNELEEAGETAALTPATTDVGATIDFNRDIRPILAENCFECHGPDSAARQAGLRLDTPEGATATLRDGVQAIVPGDPDASEALRRVMATDPADRMPPIEKGAALSDEQVRLLREWIASGAEWEPHWAFIAPKRPALPVVSDTGWSRNAIDMFVMARLEKEGLTPSPEAAKETLIRRVTFDLTGLPPTIEEIDAFLADDSPDAYEKVVDCLLSSPRYGEHMARYWLDAARFGDTHGLHLDNYRSMWRWRDWVISAFNRNMSFDQFTIEQLAGDLLPEPSVDQLIASGFNRNHVTTNEGGAIADEYLMEYAVDRTTTTATVWMGLTVGCAQCHDHKFDPISQKEFFELFAFFNNVDESGLDLNIQNPQPAIQAPTAEQQSELDARVQRVANWRTQFTSPDPQIDTAQAAWESAERERALRRWSPLQITTATSTAGSTLRSLDDGSILVEGANPAQDTYVVVAETDLRTPQLVRLEALTHDSLPYQGPGRAYNANFVLSEFETIAVSKLDPTQTKRVTFNRAYADFEQVDGGFTVDKTIDGVVDATNGWAVAGFDHREDRVAYFLAEEPFGFEGGTELRFFLRHETQHAQHGIGRFRISVSDNRELASALAPVNLSPWSSAGLFPAPDGGNAHGVAFEPERTPKRVDLTAEYLDGAAPWLERPAFVDGQINTLEGLHGATYLARRIEAPEARTLELSLGSDDAIKVWLNGEVVLDLDVARAVAPDQDRITINLRQGENQLLMKVTNLAGGYAFYFEPIESDDEFVAMLTTDLLAVPTEERTDAQRDRIRDYFRRRHSPAMRSVYEQLEAARQEEEAYRATLPFTLVMKEREERRPTHVLIRGQYDKPGEAVEPNVPAALPPMADDMTRDRLGLAEWLVGDVHPLTARVVVNRMWQQHFGVGLVATPEDFGTRGRAPSHAELLDWLAVEFVESGWDMKHMHRLMVTSATYRQSSRLTPTLAERDPENLLVARGPRFRLDAEMIRDQGLAISGLLVESIGGPSVKPYQPPGLWRAVAYPDSDTRIFEADTGDALHRRSLYTFWKRTSPPPNMAIFDAPSRETCVVRRPRTNTPLQALALMNDPQFVEMSKALAERAIVEIGSDDEPSAVIDHAFRLATARHAAPHEIAALLDLYEAQLSRFTADPSAAEALLDVGEHRVDESLEPASVAAMTMVANVILSLDETITKG